MLGSQALADALPASIDGFDAIGPAQRRTQEDSAQHTQLPTAARLYRRGDTYLKLQVMDARHAENLRETIVSADGMDDRSDNAILIGRKVGGQPASLQWTRQNRTARVGLLLEDRLVVHVSVAPADGYEVAERVAKKLDLAPLRTQLQALSAGVPGGSDRGH